MSASGAYGINSTVFTDLLKYSKKPQAAAGEIRKSVVPSYNKSQFVGGETMMFTIPTRRPNQVLSGRQSYLKLQLVNTGANAIAVDYTADSLIESLELYHGSQLCEQLRGYPALMALVKDFSGNQNVSAMLEGMHETTERTGATIAASGGTITVCLPLLSGIIGTMSPYFFPSYACSTGDLRLELTLASNVAGVVHDTAASSWEVRNPEMHLEFVQMNPAAIAKLPKEIEYSFESFENVACSIPSGTAGEHNLIPFSLSSVKALYTIWRETTNMTSATAKTASNRPNPQLAEWQYEVGGVQYPPVPVRSTEESFAELLKSHHAFGVIDELVQVKKSQYERTTTGADDSAFAIGCDFEYLTGSGARAKSGVNTVGVDVFLSQKWNSATTATYRMDTFAHADMTLKISGGQMSVSK